MHEDGATRRVGDGAPGRAGVEEDELKAMLLKTFNKRAKDGWEAERLRTENIGVHESMATIGG